MMNDRLKYLLTDIEWDSEGVLESEIETIKKQLDFEFPEDYIELIKEYNGGEGGVGKNSWICFFPLTELSLCNFNYKLLMSQIPQYYLFGKDAADTGYAFHKEIKTFHSFGLMSNFKTDSIEFCGNNFLEFIEYLNKQ